MQPIVKGTEKDAARPARPNTNEKSTPDHNSHDRLNRMADEMAGRGLEREHKDDRNIIADSDPHGKD